MARSQNVRFSGKTAKDEQSEDRMTASIAQTLKAGLQDSGWTVSEPEDWRDGGWLLICWNLAAKLDIVFAKMAPGADWMLQIAPTYYPGFLSSLLGRTASASREDTFGLAKNVHSILVALEDLKDFRWCWDGLPTNEDSSPEPNPPDNVL